eukprot:364934-Chlamydomonas_euryale.AAC.9
MAEGATRHRCGAACNLSDHAQHSHLHQRGAAALCQLLPCRHGTARVAVELHLDERVACQQLLQAGQVLGARACLAQLEQCTRDCVPQLRQLIRRPCRPRRRVGRCLGCGSASGSGVAFRCAGGDGAAAATASERAIAPGLRRKPGRQACRRGRRRGRFWRKLLWRRKCRVRIRSSSDRGGGGGCGGHATPRCRQRCSCRSLAGDVAAAHAADGRCARVTRQQRRAGAAGRVRAA